MLIGAVEGYLLVLKGPSKRTYVWSACKEKGPLSYSFSGVGPVPIHYGQALAVSLGIHVRVVKRNFNVYFNVLSHKMFCYTLKKQLQTAYVVGPALILKCLSGQWITRPKRPEQKQLAEILLLIDSPWMPATLPFSWPESLLMPFPGWR